MNKLGLRPVTIFVILISVLTVFIAWNPNLAHSVLKYLQSVF